jgi:hypothetical protein
LFVAPLLGGQSDLDLVLKQLPDFRILDGLQVEKSADDSLDDLQKREHEPDARKASADAGNTKGGSITVPLTSCLTGLA